MRRRLLRQPKFIRIAPMHHRNQHAQHRELQLQLDAIHRRFENHMGIIVIQILQNHQHQIHQNDNYIDDEQLEQDLMPPLVIARDESDELRCVVDVNARDETLLDGKPGYLEPLHDEVRPDPW